MNSQKVFAAKLLVANVADDAADLCAVFDLDAVHSLHMRLHEILIAQLLVAYLAIARCRS